LSGRYDKNENFEGRFTPRATALIKLEENSNIRLSYQTAYRFPSTQQQWIDLDVSGGIKLIGGVQELKEFYNFNSNTVYSLSSVQTGNPKQGVFNDLKPESVNSYEVGYKTLVSNKLLIDAYGYYGIYTDFIVRTFGVQSNTGNIADLATNRTIYSIPVNSENKVKTYGFGISADYTLPKGFNVGGNFSSDVLDDVQEGFVASFNAPKYRANLYVANSGFGSDKRFSFNVAYKWQDAFFYEEDFGNGKIEAIQTLDAQVGYKVPKSKSVIRLGANNLLNQYYRNAFGNPSIGGLYYVSYGYNIF
jgi:outer membrane receptor protein involved in Fe transport